MFAHVQGVTFDLTLPDSPMPETGEWAPVIGGSGGETGQVYHYQTGHYVKIGPLVQVWAYTQFSNKGNIIGNLQLKGLPFATATLPGFAAGSCGYFSNLTPECPATSVMLYIGGGTTAAGIFTVTGGYMNPRPMRGSDLNDATQLIFSLAYRVN